MKKLYLLRHAKTLAAEPGGSDRDRRLDQQGEQDARDLGWIMRKKRYFPDYVICSPAIRTHQTYDFVMGALDAADTDFPERAYGGSQGDLLAMIQNLEVPCDALLIVAHNPGIHALAAMLAKEDSPALIDRLVGSYKPGTLSVLDCPIASWSEIRPAENKLADLLEPMDYRTATTPASWM